MVIRYYQDGGLRPDTGYDFYPLQRAFADVDEPPALILFCEAKQYRDNGSRGLHMAAEALSDALGVPYVGLLGWMRRGPLPPAIFYNPDLLTLRSWWHPDDPGVYDDKRNVARFALRGSGQRSDNRAEFLAFVHHFDSRSDKPDSTTSALRPDLAARPQGSSVAHRPAEAAEGGDRIPDPVGQPDARVHHMGFDVGVGLFLCHDEDDEAVWQRQEKERFLDEVNACLRHHGLPDHREPRSIAEIDPPLPPETDPCLFGVSMGSYSSHSRRAERLAWFARYVAVRGTAPPARSSYEPELHDAYDELPDRWLTFDHLLATCGDGVVVLPRPLDEVIYDHSSGEYRCLVSAHRLWAESVALGFVLRTGDPDGGDSPVIDRTAGIPVRDRSFAALDARVPEDADAWEHWVDESDLCRRLRQTATEVLRTGALGLTG